MNKLVGGVTRYVLVLLIALQSGVMVSPILAQKVYSPIFITNFSVVNEGWSNDSSLFAFQEYEYTAEGNPDIGVQSREHNSWHSYNVDRHTFATSSMWPLPLLIPQAILPGITPYPPITRSNTFTFISPNNRFLIYPAEQPESWEAKGNWPLALIDTERYTGVLLSDVLVCGLDSIESCFSIHWSDNGTSFTLSTFPPGTNERHYYVTGYSEYIGNIAATRIEIYSDTGELLSYGGRILDISPDGMLVIGVSGDQLYLWTSNSLQIQQIEGSTSSVIGAAFSPDQQYVWYIGEDGLIEYDLESNEATILEPAINSTWIGRAWISPDGKHIAWVAKAKDSNSNGVYVEPMPGQ